MLGSAQRAIQQMAAGAGAAAAALAHMDDDEKEQQEDEDELQNWEIQIQRLDYTRYSGLRRFQVQTWLLFEDSSSSQAAAIMEITLLVLIVLSTALILIKSMKTCYHVTDYTTLERCVVNETYAPDQECYRVCDELPDFRVSYFVIEAICIGAFTIEFFARLFASPAVIGLGEFCKAPANMIDLLAIAPFYIELAFLISRSHPRPLRGPRRQLPVQRRTACYPPPHHASPRRRSACVCPPFALPRSRQLPLHPLAAAPPARARTPSPSCALSA